MIIRVEYGQKLQRFICLLGTNLVEPKQLVGIAPILGYRAQPYKLKYIVALKLKNLITVVSSCTLKSKLYTVGGFLAVWF